jgi:hypothetical protein
MSKYAPLSQRLQRHRGKEWRASFAEIEEVLGFPLPKGARSGKAWWSDADKPHVKAWSGWQAHDVDHEKGRVTFRRSAVSPAAVEAAAGLAPVGDLSGAAPPEALKSPAPPSSALAPAEPAPAKGVNPYILGGLIAGGVVAIASVAALVWRSWEQDR